MSNDVPFLDLIPEDERNEFTLRFLEICEDLEVEPLHLAMVMFFESQMNPAQKNPGSSAVGLIQFMSATARDLGTSRDALLKMTATEQLEYVQLYLRPFKGRMTTFIDTYLAVFWPPAIGKPLEYKVLTKPSHVKANKVFDTNKDGVITKGEINDKLKAWFAKHGIE